MKGFRSPDTGNKIMGIGASAGSGEVNLKFLDDVDFDSVSNPGGVMYYDSTLGKFKFAPNITISGDTLNIDTFSLLGQTVEANTTTNINYSGNNRQH